MFLIHVIPSSIIKAKDTSSPFPICFVKGLDIRSGAACSGWLSAPRPSPLMDAFLFKCIAGDEAAIFPFRRQFPPPPPQKEFGRTGSTCNGLNVRTSPKFIC